MFWLPVLVRENQPMDSDFHSGFTAAHAGVCRKLAEPAGVPAAGRDMERIRARCSSAVIVRTVRASEVTGRAYRGRFGAVGAVACRAGQVAPARFRSRPPG